jgi:hypothetical protein
MQGVIVFMGFWLAREIRTPEPQISLGFRVPSDHPSLDYGQSEQQDYPERTGISM